MITRRIILTAALVPILTYGFQTPSRLPHLTQRHWGNSVIEQKDRSQIATFSRLSQRQESSTEAPPEVSLFDVRSTSPDDGIATSVDLTHDEDHIYQKAITTTLQWVAGAAIFGTGLWVYGGSEMAEEFFAGYLVEQSLSVDNLFVFLLLFDFFKVPLGYQGRVLSWGIYGAIVMRAIMIGLGSAALHQFHGILLVFAGILVYSSISAIAPLVLGTEEDEEEDLSENTIIQFSRKIFPSTDYFDGDNFFTMVKGVKMATPLLICMIAVEISDVVFAVDSIPAVFGVTENPLIVFTSNMFAIMGLRSLYTILSKAAQDLKYLEPAVAVVLGFIGAKMIAEYFGIIIPTELALGVVTTLLAGGVGLSVIVKDEEEREDSV